MLNPRTNFIEHHIDGNSAKKGFQSSSGAGKASRMISDFAKKQTGWAKHNPAGSSFIGYGG